MWYSVIIIHKDVFESTIIEERHFGSKKDAKCFANTYKNNNDFVAVVLDM